MQQLTEFIINHWVLFAAFFVILGLLLWNLVSARRGGVEVGPMEVTRLINREDAVVIDVRDKAQYAKGHIIKAINVPNSELSERIKGLEQYRDRPLILCCQLGDISLKAGASLAKVGFTKLYRLKGGLLAWQNLHLPLTKE